MECSLPYVPRNNNNNNIIPIPLSTPSSNATIPVPTKQQNPAPPGPTASVPQKTNNKSNNVGLDKVDIEEQLLQQAIAMSLAELTQNNTP